jgi:hypothetical protein
MGRQPDLTFSFLSLQKQLVDRLSHQVNYWCEFIDHPQQPKDLQISPPPKGVLTGFQIQRAAGLINNMLNFNDMLNK